ncbi:hypothetical protein MSAN_02309000 [Mycena sanguinolenta]|uniref:Uncharacterized protein n=1 Tax=Mycena sanguinolenta TaxID=230812 RepID=A0A8H6X8I6_9AGAR|nr:hypothetical protein MSAN_02309000 [Mycena sanguinolenta]
MANATELPNPFTPLAFLSPALASQFEVSRYLFAATLGAYVWDIGLNLGNDYILLCKHRVRLSTIVYFMSRAFTLAYILACFVFQGQLVAPVENCNALAVGLDICLIAYAVFSILWMAVLGASIALPLGIRAAHIGTTTQCTITALRGNVAVSLIMPLINDTAIFFAINYRILAHMIVADSSTARLRVFLDGKGLSTLSRALLQSGQHFYLVAVAANVTLLILLELRPLSQLYHAMFVIPATALTNAMACLVFRRVKFGLVTPDGISKIDITGLSMDFHSTAASLPPRRTNPTTMELGSSTTFPLDVRVQKEVDR